jgi:hypothetical protein
MGLAIVYRGEPGRQLLGRKRGDVCLAGVAVGREPSTIGPNDRDIVFLDKDLDVVSLFSHLFHERPLLNCCPARAFFKQLRVCDGPAQKIIKKRV